MPSKRSPNPLRTVITCNNLNPTTLVRIQIIFKDTRGFKARHKMVLLNKVLTMVATNSNTEGDLPATTSNMIRVSPLAVLAKTPRQLILSSHKVTIGDQRKIPAMAIRITSLKRDR
jgi:hypothetical protein